jgi:hypothetical protein
VGLDALDEGVARVDVHASVAVGHGHGRPILGAAGRSVNSRE